jgi:hypothetical protein
VAKRANELTPQRPNSSLRVRWVEVEVNGADTTIEEALRAVERMRRPVIGAPSTLNRIGHTAIPGNGDNALPDDATVFDNGIPTQADAATTEPIPEAARDPAPGTDPLHRKRGEGDRKDRNVGIKPVGDIDFVPTGKQSLKEFFAEKAPSSDMDQILVLCHFLQHAVQSAQIGPGHILSGFKHVGKPIPKDLKKTIRHMKDKKAWLGFTNIENICLTTEGENRVEHELGRASRDVGAK